METGNWKLENHTTVAVTHKAATQIQIQIQIRTWRSQEINISVDWHARPLRVKCDSVSSFVWHSLDVFKSESIPKQINDLICIHRITKNQKKNEKRNENSCQMWNMPKEHRNIEMPQGGNQFLASPLFRHPLSLAVPLSLWGLSIKIKFEKYRTSKNT